MTEERIEIGVKHPNRCPFCHDEVRPEQPKVACEGCMAWHHRECWETHGACSACGRAEVETAAAARSADLGDRAARVTAALEEAKLGVPPATVNSGRCIVGSCPHPSFAFSRGYCAVHRAQDAKVFALVGGLNVVFWAGMLGLLGVEGGEDILAVAVIFGGFGALMVLYGSAILFAKRRLGNPPS